MKNKRGAFQIDKTLTIVIVILVLVLVFGFLFRANLPGFFNLFPSFSEAQVPSKYIPADSVFVETCTKIGEVKVEERRFGVEDKEQYVYIGKERTNLFWSDDGKEIILKRSLGGIDRLKSDLMIGKIDATGTIEINEDYLNEKSNLYLEAKGSLPPIEILNSLSGSRYVEGNILCKATITSAGSADSTTLKSLMEYAKTHEVFKRTCECGSNCEKYAEILSADSVEKGIDPLLSLSLMMQESTCKWNALAKHPTDSDRDSIGLMQISSWRICQEDSSIGINAKEDTIGEKNVEKNIKCGMYILKKNYDTYSEKGADFKGCTKTKTYYQWEAALRAYNGLGCLPSMPEQDSFVEDVTQRYNSLKQISLSNNA